MAGKKKQGFFLLSLGEEGRVRGVFANRHDIRRRCS